MNSRRAKLGGLDVALIVVAVVALCFAVWRMLGSSSQTPVLPEITTRTMDNGRIVTVLPNESWQEACRLAGLPDPPDFNGSDPVPVRAVLGEVANWMETEDPDSLGRLGQIYQAMEQHDAALDCFAAAHELDPQESLWLYMLAVECQALGHFDRAIELFEQYVQIDPAYATTYARLGDLYLEQGDPQAARENFEQYNQRERRLPIGLVGLARVALANQEYREAERHLRQAITKAPQDFMAYRFLGQALAELGQHRAADSAIRRAETLPQYSGWLSFDDHLRTSHALANTQRYLENELRKATATGNNERTKELVEELVRRRPDDYNMISTLAQLRFASGERDNAIESLADAIERFPGQRVELMNLRTLLLFSNQQNREALEQVNEALAINPESAQAHALKGRLVYLAGDHASGIASVQRAVDLDPQQLEPFIVLASMLAQQRQFEEALTVLNEAEQYHPGHPNIARHRSAIEADAQRQ